MIQLDHMDSKTATAALAIAEAHHYSGVVSAHCCSSPQLFQRHLRHRRVHHPARRSRRRLSCHLEGDKAESDPKYHFGFGWGSDMNGLADQPGPSSGTPISYPFKSYDGQGHVHPRAVGPADLRPQQRRSGQLRDVRRLAPRRAADGGRPVMNDMFQGAEAYLEMWERADGVPTMSCQPAGPAFTATGLGRRLRLGDSSRAGPLPRRPAAVAPGALIPLLRSCWWEPRARGLGFHLAWAGGFDRQHRARRTAPAGSALAPRRAG